MDRLERIDRLDRLLRSVNHNMFALARGVVHEHGMPHSTLMIMRQVHHSPGITVSEIARRSGLAKSYISKTLDTLAAAGMLEKRSDAHDQRLVRIYITERAEAHFQEVHAAVRARLAEAVCTLSSEQLDALNDGLQALESAIKLVSSRHTTSRAGDDHWCSGS